MNAVIDRIEDGQAVISANDDNPVTFNLPLEYLPKGVKEGDHLRIDFFVDREARAVEAGRVAGLLDDLKSNEGD